MPSFRIVVPLAYLRTFEVEADSEEEALEIIENRDQAYRYEVSYKQTDSDWSTTCERITDDLTIKEQVNIARQRQCCTEGNPLLCGVELCDQEAEYIVDRSHMPLCGEHAEVYEMGQSNPDGAINEIEE